VWAGAFTLNQVAAAPVQYCRAVLASGSLARGVLINAGQANAATGDAGAADSAASAAAVGAALGIPSSSILLESTGVIGQRIKMDPFLAAIPSLVAGLSSSRAAADAAATAITTTDLVRKATALETRIGGAVVRVGGMCKGSGMIHPNMATMLAALTCDAAVTAAVWRPLVSRAVAASFNQITVDGDTSTNDTVIAFASGAAGNKLIDNPASPDAAALEAAVTALLAGLAKSVASDGEGATCLIEVCCAGAADLASAQKVARSVAGSDLFKAAIFGRDPNWGRIAAAAGYAGVPFDQAQLRIAMGPHLLMERGQPLPFDAKAASGYLKAAGDAHGTVRIDVTIGAGPASALAWGCDLSYGAFASLAMRHSSQAEARRVLRWRADAC
jgi:glutamate N-acetyltransferase/amino-acid N-acetyltransferase